jgi:hypothetical protein
MSRDRDITGTVIAFIFAPNILSTKIESFSFLTEHLNLISNENTNKSYVSTHLLYNSANGIGDDSLQPIITKAEDILTKLMDSVKSNPKIQVDEIRKKCEINRADAYIGIANMDIGLILSIQKTKRFDAEIVQSIKNDIESQISEFRSIITKINIIKAELASDTSLSESDFTNIENQLTACFKEIGTTTLQANLLIRMVFSQWGIE